MATSPNKSSDASMATKDAMFLFDLFRESPTPILIQIGPYASKTGAKPNSIIKRLAGIKARNGLNISTTLGNYKRPSSTEKSGVKGTSNKKAVKKDADQFSDSHVNLAPKIEQRETVYLASGGICPGPEAEEALLTPVASPSSSISSSHRLDQSRYAQPRYHFSPVISPVDVKSAHSKRSFEETQEMGPRRSDLDGTPWKRVKTELDLLPPRS